MATWTLYDYEKIYTQEDGTRVFLTIADWAELTQTGADLTEWQTDYTTIQASEDSLRAAGTMAAASLTAVTIGENSYATVPGQKLRMESSTDSAPTWHALWDKWGARMEADANVTWIDSIWKLGNFVDQQ